MAKFRLIAGSHSQGGRRYNWKDPENNIIESDENLAASDPRKFERIEENIYNYEKQEAPRPEGGPKPNSMPSLNATTAGVVNKEGKTVEERYGGFDSRSVSELKEIAEAEEINVPKNMTKKEDIVKLLRSSK